jgi:zinc protease
MQIRKTVLFALISFSLFSCNVSGQKVVSTMSDSGLPKASDIIKNYIDAIGGADELNKVTSIDATMTMSEQGTTMNLNEKKMVPNKDIEIITLNDTVVMKSVFNGDNGYTIEMGNKTNMTADEIAQKKIFTGLTEQLDYLNNPLFKLTLRNVQKINGADAYQVDVIDPMGKTSTDYYDVQTKLLVKNESITISDGKQIMQTFEISDYRKVGKIMFPFKSIIIQSVAGRDETYVLNVTDIKLNSGVTADDFK